MRSRIVRAATGGIRGPPDPLRNPCKRPAYRPTPHTMQAFRTRSVVPPMTRLWRQPIMRRQSMSRKAFLGAGEGRKGDGP